MHVIHTFHHLSFRLRDPISFQSIIFRSIWIVRIESMLPSISAQKLIRPSSALHKSYLEIWRYFHIRSSAPRQAASFRSNSINKDESKRAFSSSIRKYDEANIATRSPDFLENYKQSGKSQLNVVSERYTVLTNRSRIPIVN